MSSPSFCQKRVERVDKGLVQIAETILVVPLVGHAGHDVVAERGLRVHHRLRVDDLASLQITKVEGNRGASYVDCRAESPVVVAGADIDDFHVVPQGHRDLPVAVPDRRGKVANDGVIEAKLVGAGRCEAGFLVHQFHGRDDGRGQPFEITQWPLECGWFQFNIIEANRRP